MFLFSRRKIFESKSVDILLLFDSSTLLTKAIRNITKNIKTKNC